MDLQHLDDDAREAALKDIKNMFQRPGQLEKVELYRHRVGRKKASVESLLKVFFYLINICLGIFGSNITIYSRLECKTN